MSSFCAIITFTKMTTTSLIFFLIFFHLNFHQILGQDDMIFKSSPPFLKSSINASYSTAIPPLSKSQMSVSQCPPELDGRCTCGIGPYRPGGRPTYITNCTGAGFKGPTSPSHYLQAIDNRTEVLIFTGNNFPELPANLLLLNRSYDQLHTVDLSNNNISTIHGKAFHNMKSVRVLYLNDNRICITGGRSGPSTGQKISKKVEDGKPEVTDKKVDDEDDGDDFKDEETESPHPRMFSPLKSLEQLHLKNAFARENEESIKARVKALKFLEGKADQEMWKASQILVTALGEVFRKSNLSTLKLLNLEANRLLTLEGERNIPGDFVACSSANYRVRRLQTTPPPTLPPPPPHFLCALPRLQHLQLAYNRLSGYPVNGSCLPWLSSVDLSNNRIVTVNKKSLNLIKSSGPALGALHINLSRNPFKCDCALLPFFRFLAAANSETADPRKSPKFEALPEYRCYLHSSSEKSSSTSGNLENKDIVGQYFDDLSEGDFGDCTGSTEKGLKLGDGEKMEAVRRYRHYITLSYIILAFLLLLLAFLLAILAFINRVWILATWNYFLLEMNYPKSDYTALDAKGDGGGDQNGRQTVCDIENSGDSSCNFDSTDGTFKIGNGTQNGFGKKNSNKGKNSKKFGSRQNGSNRSNHIRMKELKNEFEKGVAEEEV